MNATTYRGLVDAMGSYFFGSLERTEDLGALVADVDEAGKGLNARAVASCIERFDAQLRERMPRGWSVKGAEPRTVVTMVGAVSYRRTVFVDEHGRRRAWADELLGIPPKASIMPDAFLWIARTAGEMSYRKTAAAFLDRTGCAVSQVTVMRIVHRAGALLREALVDASVAASLDPKPGARISQDRVFAEADGLWVHIQAGTHRKTALSRAYYEQVKVKKSIEMKCGVVYAGKSAKGAKTVRGNARFVMLGGSASEFWEAMGAVVEREYEPGDLECVWVGTDAGGWCLNCGISESVSTAPGVTQSLDPFHVMKAIERAIPKGGVRDWVAGLVYSRKFARAVKYAKRYLATLSGKRRDKVREMVSYLESNLPIIRFPEESMGTMEGANASVWAARMKNRGMAWSARGAEAMGLIRARLAANLPLIAPPVDARFTEKQREAAEKSMARKGAAAARRESSGKGWEPPSGTLVPLVGGADRGGGHHVAGGFLAAHIS